MRWWRRKHEADDETDEDKIEEDEEEVKVRRSGSRRRKDDEPPYGSGRGEWTKRPWDPFYDDDYWFPSFGGSGRRRRRGLLDDFFAEFEDEIERMHERMDRIFKSTLRGEFDKHGTGGPFVYGFSMRVGPDGKPHIQEFGNTRPEFFGRRFFGPRLLRGADEKEFGEEWFGGREPITDIIEGDKNISVTVELPGVEREDIDLDVAEDMITIKVDTEQRKYYKEVEMPCKVKPDTTKATYKNGVLDITVERAEVLKRKPGKKIKVD
jgi:HSP20 family protein